MSEDSFLSRYAGRLVLGAFVLAALAIVVLYNVGEISEVFTGLTMATTVVLGSAAYGVKILADSISHRAVMALVIVLGLVTGASGLAAASSALTPGAPIAAGDLTGDGDVLPLPGPVQGATRLLLHGRPAGSDASEVDVHLDVGTTSAHGTIERTAMSARVGRRGRTTVLRERDSDFVTVDVADPANSVTLTRLRGHLSGPLHVEVFHEWLPLPTEIVLAAALLLAIAFIAVRLEARSTGVGALSCAMVFGIMVHHMATPDAAVRPEIGALMVAVLAGGVGGMVLAGMVRMVARPRRAGSD